MEHRQFENAFKFASNKSTFALETYFSFYKSTFFVFSSSEPKAVSELLGHSLFCCP